MLEKLVTAVLLSNRPGGMLARLAQLKKVLEKLVTAVLLSNKPVGMLVMPVLSKMLVMFVTKVQSSSNPLGIEVSEALPSKRLLKFVAAVTPSRRPAIVLRLLQRLKALAQSATFGPLAATLVRFVQPSKESAIEVIPTLPH